jgi:hemerythrin
MTLVVWADQYLIGHAVIDAQHRHLFTLAGTFIAAVDQGHGPEQEGETLDQLIAYIDAHFAAEEKLMMASHYPYLAAHQRMHVALATHTRILHADHQAGNPECARRLAEFMCEWLAVHINEDDRRLIHWFNAVQARTRT